MSQLKAEFVKTGYWVNLAKGPVMGATITTSTTTGNLVIALLAVLTTLGTTHLWNLITFTYYQCHLHYRPADGLYWQQQALLRTLPTPATLVSDWLRLWWSWRKRTDKVLQRTLPPVAISFIFTVAIVAAGIFSSYIVDGKNIEVLVRSRFCGPLNFEAFLPDTDTYDPIAVIKHYSKITALGYSYAKDCYETGNQPERCQIFIQPTVPIRQERVECPFGNRLCKNIDLPGIVLDSDYVNLNSFGLNLEEKDRVGYRKRTTCAVFELRDHSVIINAADLESFEYLYGEKPYKDEQLVLLYFGESSYADFTFSTSLFRQNFSGTLTVDTVSSFKSPRYAIINDLKRPLPEMGNSSDIILLNIKMGSQKYGEPVDDIMFSAHQMRSQSNTMGEKISHYVSDSPVSVVGCQLQYQFCYADKGGSDVCTDLDGLLAYEDLLRTSLGASRVQLAVLENLTKFSIMFDMAAVSNHFHAADEVGDLKNSRVPPKDTWVREITFWEQYVWSQLQIAFTNYAIGPATLDPTGQVAQLMLNDPTEAQKQLCSKQKMRSPGGFVNINVFGLALTISVCCLVVAIDLVLLRFLIYLKSFRRALSPRIVRWIDDGLFQIQRKAFEAHGEGTWECLDEVVPVTTTNTELSWGSGPCKCLANSGSGSGTSITANSTGGTADSATVDSNSSDDRQTPVQNSSSPVTTPADPTLVASPTDSSGLVNLVTDDMVIETPTTNIDPGMINPAADDTVMEAPETNINSTPEPERM